MKNLIQLSFLIILFFFACNDSDDDLCELGPVPPISCSQEFDPVCGCNNVTYSNSCVATLNGVPSFIPGECP